MRHKASGFALPTVMVMLTLASIATLLAMRQLWVNEQLLNARADQLRSRHKAEAVISAAVADILGLAKSSDAAPHLRHTAGDATHTHAFFPSSIVEYELLRQRLSAYSSPCSAGICAPHTLDPMATKASYWTTQTSSAMSVSTSDTPYGDNTAWYWVEIFPQSNVSTTNAAPQPPFVYRITALSDGVMPGSRTVLQAIWTKHSNTSLTGQWHSWHVLHD